jgi:energy-coupling factor transporter ATP-binding protein EcfA2
MPLFILLLISLILLLLSKPDWNWFKKRFSPFLLSLASLSAFSLLFGANLEKIMDIAIRCAGIFLLFSALLLKIPPSQIISMFSPKGKHSSISLFFYLLYRYISLITEEGERMIRAARARSGNIRRLFYKSIKLFINYILRVLKRSEVIAMAIEARGWEGIEKAVPDDDYILIEDVSFAYQTGKKALKNINLKIKRGEKVALLGANGAGKSTLLWVIGGFLKPEGKVKVFGVEVKKENLAKLRKMVGILFEDPDDQLLMPTVLEDVMFGLLNIGYNREEAEKIARENLRKFGLERYEETHPHNLSQGEKRKASLVGVLSMRPEVLLLDEPSANLDGRGKRELFKILRDLEGTLIIASHDLSFVRELCERAVVLTEGEIVFDGYMKDLLKREDILVESGIL